MTAMSRRNLVVLCTVVLLLATVLWATVAWVPSAGGLWVWSAETGRLRVPESGPAIAPRWSGERLDAHRLAAEVPAATADGAKVATVVELVPPVGAWQLQAADTPGEGLRRSVADTVRQTVGGLPLVCFIEGSRAPAECPPDAEAFLRQALAMSLGVPEASVSVALEPDRAEIRGGLLADIASRLSIPRHKVLVLGLDGLDWDLVLPWVESGRMPNLKRLMDTGTWGEMTTLVPMLSPLIWTSMVTGVSADVHGVLDFVEKDPETGQMAPVTGRSRKVPAVWNIASALGLSVDVVGWWATWPAERVNGTMVSDRLYYTLQQGIPEEVFHEDPPDLVFPPQRIPEFTDLRDRAVAETDWRAVRFLMDVPEDVFDRAVAGNLGMEDPVDGMRRILSATRTYLGAGLALAAEKPDLMMVYLEGTDTIGHLLAQYLPPPTLEIDDATAAVYAAAVPVYFEIVDRWIGRYLETCPLEDYAVVLVSDHGFKWGRERPRGLSGTAGPTAPLWHADDAVFVIAGAGVTRRGRVQEKPSVYDVAPTLAALLGVPADPAWPSAVLPGSPAANAAPVEWGPLVPPASYSQSGGGAAPVDPEFIAKLKALGYIGEDGTSAGGTAAEPSLGTPADRPAPSGSEPAAPTPQPATATRGQINNLAVIKINEKKYDEAERLLRQAIAMSPEYASPHYNLRRMYMEMKEWEKADEQLWIAVDKGLRDPERTIDRAAADYESLSLPDRAEALLTRAIARYPEHEPYYVHLMVLRIRADRCAEALPVGAVASQKFPDSGPVHAFYGLAAACVGDAGVARRQLEWSLQINPNQPMLRDALSQLPPPGGG